MYNIMIVDDDKDINNILSTYFKSLNYDVTSAFNGKECLEKLDDSIDIILLDIMMPELDGISTLKLIRENSTVPVVFLTAKNDDLTKISGLLDGADDYIAKPFNIVEVSTKVSVILRRNNVYNTKKDTTESCIEYKGIKVNTSKYKAFYDDIELNLTKREFNLLLLLLNNIGKVITYDEIIDNIQDDEFSYATSNNIAVHVKNIHKKINTNVKIISNVRGVGYTIE